MPTYSVILTRDITESTVVDVQAASSEEAERLAHEKLLETTDAVWRVDDGSWNQSDIYATGVDPVEED